MSAPPFALVYTDEALRVLDDLTKPAYAAKLKKAKRALRLLRDVGPNHPGLNSHKYQSLTGPNGEEVSESYVENTNARCLAHLVVGWPGAGHAHDPHPRPHP